MGTATSLMFDPEIIRQRRPGQDASELLDMAGKGLAAARNGAAKLLYALRTQPGEAWRQHVADHPPSHEVLAYLLALHEESLRREIGAARIELERANTAKARETVERKTLAGTTKSARAMKLLEDMKRRGDNVMDAHVTRQIADSVGCDQRLVRTARGSLLARK